MFDRRSFAAVIKGMPDSKVTRLVSDVDFSVPDNQLSIRLVAVSKFSCLSSRDSYLSVYLRLKIRITTEIEVFGYNPAGNWARACK